jgi:hypothetical protein
MESIAEAADKAASRMRQLRSRMSDPAETTARVVPREIEPVSKAARVVRQDPETIEEMERQLQQLFEQTPGYAMSGSRLLHEIRGRVVDGVAERILAAWGAEGADAGMLEDEVVERLIVRVLERLRSGKSTPRIAENGK